MENKTTFGLMAEKFLGVQLPLQVLKSNAGFYIGTFVEFDVDANDEHRLFGPLTRESVEYFPNQQTAENALSSGMWQQKNTI